MESCLVPNCARRLYALGLCNAHYLSHRKYPDETWEQLGARNRQPRTPERMLADALARLVPAANGCAEWTGSRDVRGYGNIRWDGKLWGAHRLIYHLAVAPVPAGTEVCHKCDNPPCCNVDHLFLGSHADNMTDAAMKGRMAGNSGRSGAANGRALFTADQVRAIRAASGTQSEIARTFGTSQPVISKIRRHESYVDVT